MMVTAKRARATGLLMLVIMFAVGALAGAATVHVAEGDEVGTRRGEQRDRPSLFEVLQLTPEQQTQVDAIMERRRAEMDAFWTEHRPLLDAIMDSARAEIRTVLTPEQQEIEQRFREERRRHHNRNEPRSR
jgi:Spy/CpxP family protein refolding chaperone